MNYFLVVYIDKKLIALEQVLSLLNTDQINLKSFNSCILQKQELYKMDLVIGEEHRSIKTIIQQIRKLPCTISVNCYTSETVTHIQLCTFKISYTYFLENTLIQDIIDKYYAEIVKVTKDFIFIEKKGDSETVSGLLNELSPHGLINFEKLETIMVT